jgi:hypothetical protein
MLEKTTQIRNIQGLVSRELKGGENIKFNKEGFDLGEELLLVSEMNWT